MLLHGIVTAALKRLDDESCDYWTREELEVYSRDAYDTFARRTKCIFDVVVIENVSPTAGVGSDLQHYLAEHTPGMTVHDRRLVYTQPGERDRIREPLAASDALSIDSTVESQATGPVPSGKLPAGVVEVLRVTWDRKTLMQATAQGLRLADPSFETREGDPQAWLWGEDGLMSLRVWPAAAGDATYDTLSGDIWGDESYCDDGATVDLGGDGEWGILSGASDEDPSGGLWGIAGRRHPDVKNIRVEVVRLGRDPQAYDLEIPRSFQKYIIFGAMAQALKREGPGQDLKLAQHLLDRFEYGVVRMEARLRGIQPERKGQLGGGGGGLDGQLQISLPAWWGYARRVRG